MLIALFLFFIDLSVAGQAYDMYGATVGRTQDSCNDPYISLGVLNVECNLNSSRFTFAVSRTPQDVTITFNQDSTMVCDDLQKAKPHIDEFMLPVILRSKQLEIFKIIDVTLPPFSLFCPLAMIHAVGCDTLILKRPKGKLLPVHVEGFEGVKKFRLRVDRSVTSVPYDVLSALTSLYSFTLTGGALALRTERVELERLIYLELSEGNLKSLPKGAFKHLPNLKKLFLWGNRINNIDVDAFEGLLYLTELSLDSNLIKVLPEGVFRFSPNLFRIDLRENCFTDLTENVFTGLNSLNKIKLFRNYAELMIHNRTFAHLPSLTQLELDGNSIRSLPADVFTNSTNIQYIYLNSNKLNNLPETIFFGLNLKNLTIKNNKLASLFKYQFLNQTNLQHLELQENSLTELPVGLFNDLNNLETLNLSSNSIEKLDNDTFYGLEKLTKLFLANNKIKVITEEFFYGTPNLEILSLANNSLIISKSKNTKKLADDYISLRNDDSKFYSALMNCKHLKELDLSNNNISIICSDWRKFYYLKKLNLSNNQITELSAQDTNFHSNATIILSYNKLQYIDFTIPTGPSTFILNNNPFICNCKLFPFINRRHQNNYNVLPSVQMDDAKCFQPSHLSNTKLTDVRPDMLTCDTTCPIDCFNCVIRPDAQQVELTCTKTPEIWPNLTNDYNSASIKLQKLDNRYLNLPPTVHNLDVSNLSLTEPPILLCDTTLVVNLTHNLLTVPPFDLLGKNCSIYIEHNPIECECGHEIDIQKMFFYNASIKDFKILRCSDKRLISTMDLNSLCYRRNLIIAVSGVLLFIILLMVILLIFFYKNSILIRILINNFCSLSKKADFTNYKYDAFISFVDDNEKFVTEKVIPNLENSRNPLKLCIHSRDWVIGGVIAAQIETSVEQSRKTIIVLSKKYLESKWCEMEFRVAHSKDRVIILMLEDFSNDASLSPELKAYISLKTYVKVSDPFVWDRLKYAVLRNNNKIVQTDKTKRVGLDARLNKDGRMVNNNDHGVNCLLKHEKENRNVNLFFSKKKNTDLTRN